MLKTCMKGVAVLLLSVSILLGTTINSASSGNSQINEPTTTGSIPTISVATVFVNDIEQKTTEQAIEESTTMSEMIVEEKPSTTKATVKALTTIPQTEERPLSETNSLGQFKLTAYCPCSKCCGKWAGGITSTGVMAKANHTIAVDPSVIPYGSKVIINDQTYIAQDCGGAIKDNNIDIYFNTHSEALDFGVQYAEVYLVVE